MVGVTGGHGSAAGVSESLRLRAFDDLAAGQRLIGAAGRRAGMTLGEIYEAAKAAAELLEAAFHLAGRPPLLMVRDAARRRRLGIELALELPRAARLLALRPLCSRFGRFRAGRTASGRARLTAVRWKRHPNWGAA